MQRKHHVHKDQKKRMFLFCGASIIPLPLIFVSAWSIIVISQIALWLP